MKAKTDEKRMNQARRHYRVIEERMAPFMVPKPLKTTVSTAGQWRSPSSTAAGTVSCLPGDRCLRDI